MKIHHLNCGSFCPAFAKLMQGRGGILDCACISCTCLLIENENGLVLVDTGLGVYDFELIRKPSIFQRLIRASSAPRQWRETTAFSQIQKLGFDPRDVKHIVLTHADYDHAGGVADFPNASIHLAQREYLAIKNKDPKLRLRYWKHHVAMLQNSMQYKTRLDGEEWMGFKAVTLLKGLTEDLLLVPLPGHSPGHAGVAVRSNDRWLLHVGDAIMHHNELLSGDSIPMGYRLLRFITASDREKLANNRGRLIELVKSGRVLVINSHDPDMQFGWRP